MRTAAAGRAATTSAQRRNVARNAGSVRTRESAFGKALLRPDHHRVAQLAQRFVLDLADALTGEADALADFLEGHRVFAVEAVAELEDLRRAVVDRFEEFAELAELIDALDDVAGAGVMRVGDEVAHRHLAVARVIAAAELRRRVVRLHRL